MRRVEHSELHVDPSCKYVMGWEIEILNGVIAQQRNPNRKRGEKWELFRLCGWRSGVWGRAIIKNKNKRDKRIRKDDVNK